MAFDAIPPSLWPALITGGCAITAALIQVGLRARKKAEREEESERAIQATKTLSAPSAPDGWTHVATLYETLRREAADREAACQQQVLRLTTDRDNARMMISIKEREAEAATEMLRAARADISFLQGERSQHQSQIADLHRRLLLLGETP